ncbi:hypothetical protein B0T11DRAFT_298817 [Plectosphaerella cucumerina]|uniref:Uncharacterized protein n=1 Tax=Plectosphaerella cucumerina TaxID=40658 RepID=A0A8K0THP1_9PEZI|nr:hypothetical protein B0T11DRAFT_298817 [Plectosphaerella cucumerina]
MASTDTVWKALLGENQTFQEQLDRLKLATSIIKQVEDTRKKIEEDGPRNISRDNKRLVFLFKETNTLGKYHGLLRPLLNDSLERYILACELYKTIFDSIEKIGVPGIFMIITQRPPIIGPDKRQRYLSLVQTYVKDFKDSVKAARAVENDKRGPKRQRKDSPGRQEHSQEHLEEHPSDDGDPTRPLILKAWQGHVLRTDFQYFYTAYLPTMDSVRDCFGDNLFQGLCNTRARREETTQSEQKRVLGVKGLRKVFGQRLFDACRLDEAAESAIHIAKAANGEDWILTALTPDVGRNLGSAVVVSGIPLGKNV